MGLPAASLRSTTKPQQAQSVPRCPSLTCRHQNGKQQMGPCVWVLHPRRYPGGGSKGNPKGFQAVRVWGQPSPSVGWALPPPLGVTPGPTLASQSCSLHLCKVGMTAPARRMPQPGARAYRCEHEQTCGVAQLFPFFIFFLSLP